ncbi:MAG: pseudouridine synthase [Myxococcota bacterium]|nr:pseudouridine synthase [Myxococcota bacterium]
MIPAVKASPKTIRAVALHKPPGYLSTRVKPSTPKRPSAYDCLPYGWDTPEAPLGACGRLDKESSGLLLFTDDGLLSQALLHPRFEHQAITETPSHIAKTYHLQLSDAVSNTQLHELAQPITLGEGRKRGPVTTLPAEVSRVNHPEPGTWLSCTLYDGKNRQIRRLCRRSGLKLLVLRRVSLGPIAMDALAEGQARSLSQREIEACYQLALPGLPVPRLIPPSALAR